MLGWVAHTGVEPVISALRGRCPRPLDECALFVVLWHRPLNLPQHYITCLLVLCHEHFLVVSTPANPANAYSPALVTPYRPAENALPDQCQPPSSLLPLRSRYLHLH